MSSPTTLKTKFQASAFKTALTLAVAFTSATGAQAATDALKPTVPDNSQYQGWDPSFPAPKVFLQGLVEYPYRARTKEDCGTVDVRDHLSPELQEFFSHPRIEGYFGHNPGQDNDVGFCFAMASADLLTYQTGKPVSAFYMFLSYISQLQGHDLLWRDAEGLFDTGNSPVPDGGVAYKAVKLSLEKMSTSTWYDKHFGMCEEDMLPSSHRGDIDLDLPQGIRTLTKAIAVAKAHGDYQTVVKQSKMAPIFKGFGQTPEQQEDLMEKMVLWAAQNNIEIVQLLKTSADTSCKGHFIEPNAEPSQVVNVGHGDVEIMNTIDAQLNEKTPNMPVILYDTGFTRTSRRPSPTAHFFGGHVSPIIGRQWNNKLNQCEYHIRDSLFGDACDNYNPHSVRCAGDGTFWTTDFTLWAMTSYITYIKQPGQ